MCFHKGFVFFSDLLFQLIHLMCHTFQSLLRFCYLILIGQEVWSQRGIKRGSLCLGVQAFDVGNCDHSAWEISCTYHKTLLFNPTQQNSFIKLWFFCLCQYGIVVKKPLKGTSTKIIVINYEHSKPFNWKRWTQSKNQQSIRINKILILPICLHASSNVFFQKALCSWA